MTNDTFLKIHRFYSFVETSDESQNFNPRSSHKSSQLLCDLCIERPLSDQAAMEIVFKNPRSVSYDDNSTLRHPLHRSKLSVQNCVAGDSKDIGESCNEQGSEEEKYEI